MADGDDDAKPENNNQNEKSKEEADEKTPMVKNKKGVKFDI